MSEFTLQDETVVSCWYSANNHAGEPVYIWSDCRTSISYRVLSEASAGEWKEIKKHLDFARPGGKFVAVPHPRGTPCGIELLPAGSYKIEFRVGEEVFLAEAFYVQS
jgi:hypothetical protein